MTSFLRFVGFRRSHPPGRTAGHCDQCPFGGVAPAPVTGDHAGDQVAGWNRPRQVRRGCRVLPYRDASVDTAAPARGSRAVASDASRIRTRWSIAVAGVVVAMRRVILPRVERRFGWRDGISYDLGAAEVDAGRDRRRIITLTGFVLTAVTLIVQTVQGQSPRLLRVLDRTDTTPLLFGTFTATFTFALVALSQVRPDSVPDVSVTLALLRCWSARGCSCACWSRSAPRSPWAGWQTIGNRLPRADRHPVPGALRSGLRGRRAGAPPRPPRPAPPGDADPSWPDSLPGRARHLPGITTTGRRTAGGATGTELRFIPAIGDFLVDGATLAEGSRQAPDTAKLARLGPGG